MISTCQSPLRQPIVPNARPMSQIASAQPFSSRSVSSGRAEVVKSRSLCRRPSIASRTGPPTSASSWPASVNRRPSSSMTGAIRSSSAATERWTSAIWRGSKGASDTGDESRALGPGGPIRTGAASRVGACHARRFCLPSWRPRSRASSSPPSALPRPAPPRPPAPKATEQAPLAVTIDRLTPSALPRTGPIRVSGTVTNVDDETWTTINLYPFASVTPITSTAELAEAADTDTEAPVGERITDPARTTRIDELAPGETMQYSFAVPRKRIPAQDPGVYWFGVHALGANADSRARRHRRRSGPHVPAAGARPARPARSTPRWCCRSGTPCGHDADGRVADVPGWTTTLSSEGQLRALTDFGVAAGDRPLTWLVDPAVTDAVTSS